MGDRQRGDPARSTAGSFRCSSTSSRSPRAGTAVVLAVVAELHDRLDNRISALTEFLVARLNEIEDRTGDRNSGFVEGYLLSHGQEAAVVPFGRRGRGAAER